MYLRMDMKDINVQISQWLTGSLIDSLTYYITGWELSFVNQEHHVDSVFSEIEIMNPQDWGQISKSSPLDLTDTNEYEDTLNAIVLFTVINKYKVIKAQIDESNNLIIEFENESKLLIPSKDKGGIEDATWWLRKSNGQSIECEWGKIILNNNKIHNN